MTVLPHINNTTLCHPDFVCVCTSLHAPYTLAQTYFIWADWINAAKHCMRARRRFRLRSFSSLRGGRFTNTAILVLTPDATSSHINTAGRRSVCRHHSSSHCWTALLVCAPAFSFTSHTVRTCICGTAILTLWTLARMDRAGSWFQPALSLHALHRARALWIINRLLVPKQRQFSAYPKHLDTGTCFLKQLLLFP